MNDISSSKLFNEFEFTFNQIYEMGNDNKDLDELFTDKNYQIGRLGLIESHDIDKFKFEYMAKKQNFKNVKQLLYVLVFFPSGMTLHDID